MDIFGMMDVCITDKWQATWQARSVMIYKCELDSDVGLDDGICKRFVCTE